MEDLIGKLDRWCEQARKLLEASTDGSTAAALSPYLELIDEGGTIRRAIDRQPPNGTVDAARRRLFRLLIDLRQYVEGRFQTLAEDSPERVALARQVRQWLFSTRFVLNKLAGDPEIDLLVRALAVEGLRGDIDWLGGLISRLDREPPDSPAAVLEVERERVQKNFLSEHEPRRRERQGLQRLIARSERLRAVLLERRVRRELRLTAADADAETMLAQRIRLSRLQARLGSIDQNGEKEEEGDELGTHSDPEEWAESLSLRRIELGQRAAEQLESMDRGEAWEACVRAAHSAQDETTEAVAFLEDVPLPRAVKRLELARQDLEQLSQILRQLTKPPRDEPDDSEGESKPTAGAEIEPGPDTERERQLGRFRILRLARDLDRQSRELRGEWQEKLLSLRLVRLLGRRAVRVMETAVFWMIGLLAALILAETLLDQVSWFNEKYRAIFAWADLIICSALLLEFGLRFALAPHRWLYLRRHFLIDFLASLPVGFVSYQIEQSGLESTLSQSSAALWLHRVLQIGELVQVLRYVRVVLPLLRLARVGLFLLKLSDRLVRRYASLLNRNIVLFEPLSAQKPESGDRHRLTALRGELEDTALQLEGRLDRPERRQLASRVLTDLGIRLSALPDEALDAPAETDEGNDSREIPVEAVVDRLIQLSPERLIDRMGPAFVASADRYLRLLDSPVIRRLPVIRSLVAYRQKSPAEAVTLAANYLGHLVQRVLEMIYFLADLQGTLSPAVFLDRLGATIVNTTRTPAKRLLWTGSAFLVLYLVVNAARPLEPFRGFVDRLQRLLGWPVIVLGVICLGLWWLGSWFRKIANQSADFCERVAEAQFAAQTKSLKSRRRDQDAQFLADRVIDPEVLLRSSDDQKPEIYRQPNDPELSKEGQPLFLNRELSFLRNIRLLYQDYLDGSPFHRSDTKASVQLLGNLALTNLRRSHLGHLLREGRALNRLDLNRAGRILGGPYLWFNYINRMIVQETAILLLDYNRHAIPAERLSCASWEYREKFRNWLARRLRVEPEEIVLPEPLVPLKPPTANATGGSRVGKRRPEAEQFLETVEFTAMDFLSDDPQRDEGIRARFGAQVMELVRRDRQQIVRRAFRSFPLHELPLVQRTINPYGFYQAHLSHGRIVLLPLLVFRPLVRAVSLSVRSVYRLVHEILHPQVEQEKEIPADAYWAALRKIHRMRKPVFMESLWLRARFDVEYLGLELPTAPPGIAVQSLMEHDLDFIGATRQDRIIAEQIRRGHQRRLGWISRWLYQFHWTFEELPAFLARELPHLSNRGGEALRALVLACVLDHDDITSLGFSIEGLKRVMAHGAEPRLNGKMLPPGLPDPVVNLRRLWRPVQRRKRPLSDLFSLPCFPPYDQAQQARILAYLRKHRRAVRGWINIVLGQGGDDPWAEVRDRMRSVLLRTDLWSDEILVLRAVQTLTMLDVQHNCELVWSLGGYGEPSAEAPATAQPGEQGTQAVEATAY